MASSWRTPLARAVRAYATRKADVVTERIRADVVVVGGGVAGAALACALRANPTTENLSVTVIDGKTTDARAPVEGVDARCVALTPRSRAFLEHRCSKAWSAMEATGRAGAFTRMQVWDGVGGGHVTYDAEEVGSASLGHVVENSVVLEALEAKMEALGVRRVRGGTARAHETPDEDAPGASARVTIETTTAVGGETSGETTTMEIETKLIVAADGPKSAMRQRAGIKIGGWGYGQRAVVGTVRTEKPNATAWQRFLPTGPIALLPIGDGTLSNVVWTTTPSEAKRLAEETTDEEFASEVNDALQGLGKYVSPHQENFNSFAALRFIEDATGEAFKPVARAARSAVSALVGVPLVDAAERDAEYDFAPRFEYPPECSPAGARGSTRGSFPLSTHHALRLTKPRLALIGDAAHVVHPLGGQGLNLGLRDAELLADAIADARALGQDIGSANALAVYARNSIAANAPMMAALDGLQKLFAADVRPVALARSFGLAAVNATGPVRRKIAWYAMGAA